MTALSTDISQASPRPERAGTPPLSERRPNKWLIASAVVLLIAYGPLLVEFCLNLWSKPQYQYFPFVLGAFAWLLWRNGATSEQRPPHATRAKQLALVALLALAWLLLACSYLSGSPWLAIISALLLLGSRFLSVSLDRRVHYLWGLWAMLWLIVPLPLNRDQQLITFLQRLSSRFSSMLLDAAGVDHLMDGNTLLLPDKQFFVDEACSGIVSVLSVIACAVIYGLWKNRRPLHVVLLAATGVGWAMIMNVLRITTIALAYDKFGVDWSAGAVHETLGLVVFTLVFLALISTDLLLAGLLTPIGPVWEETTGGPPRIGGRLIKWWDRAFAETAVPPPPTPKSSTALPAVLALFNRMSLGTISLVAFGVLAVLQFVPHNSRDAVAAAPRPTADLFKQHALALSSDALPAQTDNLHFVKFVPENRKRSDLLADHSRIFEYQDGRGSTYIVSCDFPYQEGWHELTLCYTGIGWDLTRRQIGKSESNDKTPWEYMEAEFAKPDGSRGYLLASAFDDAGKPMELPTYSLAEDAWHVLTGTRRPAHQLTFQIQVWVTAGRAIDDEERATAKKLLFLARTRFRELIANTATAAPTTPQSTQPAEIGTTATPLPAADSTTKPAK